MVAWSRCFLGLLFDLFGLMKHERRPEGGDSPSRPRQVKKEFPINKSFPVISSDEMIPDNFDTIKFITSFVEKKINSK